MVTDATRKYRDIIAIGLVAVAALYFIAALSMLFRSDTLFAGAGGSFADNAALSGYLFSSVVPVASLVLAVLLVTRYGEPAPTTRIVVLAALGIAALDVLFAVISFFAQFGSDLDFGIGGTLGGGTFSGVVLGLAHLALLGAASLYLYTALRSLPAASPAPAPAPPWGAPGQTGYGGWASPGAGQPGAGQPGLGQAGYGQQSPAQGSWQQPAPTYGWGQADSGQQPSWGAPEGQAAAGSGWGAPSGGWHDPAAAQQGQPASAWTQAGQEWGASSSAPSAPAWDQQPQQPQPQQQPQQPVWGSPAGASEWRPDDAADTTDPQRPAESGDDRGPAVFDTTIGEPLAGLAEPSTERFPDPAQADPAGAEPDSSGTDPDSSAAEQPGTEETSEDHGGWWRRP